ncbi:MAG: response regulator [Bacteroidota bacterium]
MSNPIQCIIVDDEPLAQRVIEKFLEDLNNFQVVSKCNNAFEAMDAINQHSVDLMFLDINMPKLSGMSFLKTLKNPPLVIITTAYSEYAIEGYELDVVDYLKKPFSFERFFKAVQKVQERLKKVEQNSTTAQAQIEERTVEVSQELSTANFIFVKANKKNYKVDIDDIFFIEALGDYIKIHTSTVVLVTYQSMKKIESVLPSNIFVRIHKSYIVSVNKIKSVEGNMVEIKNEKLSIGNSYKQQFQEFVDHHSIS